MTSGHGFPALNHSVEAIIDGALSWDRRVLLFGEPGVGKSTLAAELARKLLNAGRPCRCIGADPGSPAFGVPGAVCLGERVGPEWKLVGLEALCTLDAGRFRLPLLRAVQRLADREVAGMLLVDAPGVVRRVAGAELLMSLVDAAAIDVVLVLTPAGRAPPLSSELRAIGIEVILVEASAASRRPGKRERARRRTRRWDAYLGAAEERCIQLSDVQLVGTPPPIDAATAWTGRQIAFLDGSRTVALGEALGSLGANLRFRMPQGQRGGKVLLVRDARRGEDGFLNTAQPFGSTTRHHIPPADVRPHPAAEVPSGPCPVVRVGAATAMLVNGVFGDPLVHLRLQQQRRSLLLDLGEGGRLPARVAHQVTHVFISHAHVDHIGGFLWLLRSRIGDFPACRILGPPGLSGHIASLIGGIHWDRIGDYGPRFEIAELQGGRLARFAIRTGTPGVEPTGEETVKDGIVLSESALRVRAITLDHGTPVLAFAVEQPTQINIKKERLSARGLASGPWLGELKRRVASDDREAPVRLPGGQVESTGALADDLVVITPGQKLVYATDVADTVRNRKLLTGLAKAAHTLFCEAAFIDSDAEQAARTGHLTARACGEIAKAAGVEHLVPFHFSRRYEKEPERVYEEVRAVCSQAVVPRHGESAGI